MGRRHRALGDPTFRARRRDGTRSGGYRVLVRAGRRGRCLESVEGVRPRAEGGVIAAVPACRSVASSQHEDFRWAVALMAACAALDAVATGIFLLDTPLPPVLDALAATVSHLAA